MLPRSSLAITLVGVSIHVAITRRVRPGREAEFQAALREFLKSSFEHDSVHGASMLVPPAGSDSREHGILRTFADADQRDRFYASPLFQEWEAKARTLTEGEPLYRELHGLEAFFRSPLDAKQGTTHGTPPRWKMAVVTLAGVFPTSVLLAVTVGRWTYAWPLPARSLLISTLMVACLAWGVMPLLTRWLRPWLTAVSS